MRLQVMIPSSSQRDIRGAVLAFAACFLVCMPATAWSQNRDREAREAEEKVLGLLKRAEDLQAAGKREEAAELARKAEELKL